MLAGGGLLLKKKCGEQVCSEYFMCSAHDYQCYPCVSYCNASSHNFDADICEQQCQDYIHDYLRHYVRHKDVENALQELESLKSLIIFMTVLVAIALIFISITLTFIWSRERRIRKIKNGGQDSYFKKKLASLQYLKRRKDKVNTVSESVANKMPMHTSLAATTQTDMMTSSSSSASSAQRTNTSSAGGGSNSSCSSNNNKLPCEDATLEFAGYDNFALKVSPVLGKTTTTVDLLQQYSP